MTLPAPAAVTGIGCICAAGRDLPAAMASMAAGRRSPRPPARFSTGRTPSATRSSASPTTLSRRISSAGTDLLLTTRFALAATRQALADAGWDPGALQKLRVGVCLGTTVGSALNIEDFYREYRTGGQPGPRDDRALPAQQPRGRRLARTRARRPGADRGQRLLIGHRRHRHRRLVAPGGRLRRGARRRRRRTLPHHLQRLHFADDHRRSALPPVRPGTPRPQPRRGGRGAGARAPGRWRRRAAPGRGPGCSGTAPPATRTI